MIDGRWQPIKMPYNYVVEMVCDRVAACKVYQKEKYTDASPLAYYLSRNDQKYMHPNTAKALEEALTMIQNKGEKATFATLKKRIKEHYTY